jgi:hypothetical protein
VRVIIIESSVITRLSLLVAQMEQRKKLDCLGPIFLEVGLEDSG